MKCGLRWESLYAVHHCNLIGGQHKNGVHICHCGCTWHPPTKSGVDFDDRDPARVGVQ